ncbi:CU044_5270 family protein [Actinomadura sp. HBU206391]|uniref:CU044_5270 family protein n=1 Tax=Actinomadura sp. HBU206391 TaxID=2731692 RepID=UPI00164FC321|nr:CU044_5270 family protein [Actinomadura sp. HBU206391]MBC6460783.1 CU044_5270 family protein [Actinomadura sp. HBU206391]
MDDLKRLGTLLAMPDPAPEVTERSRRRLQNTMRGPARRRRIGWTAGGLSLTAAAAAAALVVASNSTAPTATPNSPPAKASMSGRQILLAAATSAEHRPASTGTYWNIKHRHTPPVSGIELSQTWTRRDGQVWISFRPGMISSLGRRGFHLGGVERLSLSRFQKLPTDPAKLKAEVVAMVKDRKGRSADEKGLDALHILNELLVQAPTSPQVRAAAFRAIATFPHVKSLGKVSGGEGVLITLGDAGTKMIIDLKTSQVSNEGFTNFGGKRESMGTSTFTAEWTNELPGKVVPLSAQVPKREPLHRPPAASRDLTGSRSQP